MSSRNFSLPRLSQIAKHILPSKFTDTSNSIEIEIQSEKDDMGSCQSTTTTTEKSTGAQPPSYEEATGAHTDTGGNNSNCRDCKGCKNCSNCVKCTNCTNCSNCVGCEGSKNLSNCYDCVDCTNCSNCSGLKNRKNASNEHA
ncbi:hypothetical protein BDV96DRAFT_580411 [Lophiotrema nucula]|uniref:TNFR-Cys domain-containing protein n=1 Tax=Lophiotrema nucula TaxID=690887 RepID=A0A6A5YYM2_9PLEO|nr:hypothetical protein BDV96DRAFT_580411 [Lophiotrema nucula]